LRDIAAFAPVPEFDDDDLELPSAPVVDGEVTQAPVRVERMPGRNDPCYCGSGKKFKLCHGR